MSASKKLASTLANAAAGEALYVDDVFSTYLYTGNGSTQTITNGIDLAGEGGLVWIKARSNSINNYQYDTDRGAGYQLNSDTTSGQSYQSVRLNGFTNSGFTLGNNSAVNGSGLTYASWTFRKAPGFFDVVTYTGNGNNGRTVAHNLGSVPGVIIIKRTNGTGSWVMHHRSFGSNNIFYLNSTTPENLDNNAFYDTNPTSTEFTLNNNTAVNGSSDTYVAYLFAHNDGDGEFGESGDQDIISCGIIPASTQAEINLGWEAQWILYKESYGNWNVFDSMRGMNAGTTSGHFRLNPNATTEEQNQNFFPYPTANGFYAENYSGEDWPYIAIRRGPMKTPESGTEVFAIDLGDSSGEPEMYAGFPVDLAFRRAYNYGYSDSNFISSRLTQGSYLITNSTDAEASNSAYMFDYMDSWWAGSMSDYYISWMFRRAPGFFDVVAYSGDNSVGRTVTHNLGVAPELIFVKIRSGGNNWAVYAAPTGNTKSGRLNENLNFFSGVSKWNSTSPTSTEFTVSGTDSEVNASGYNYIAYLFATLAGVSKVGSYTGNGTSQTIDCGFSSGARFVLIKRTDSTGDWHVWDTERGIVAGNDPFLELNTTNGENSSYDSVDPYSAGFTVNEDAGTAINTSGGSYIYLAIA